MSITGAEIKTYKSAVVSDAAANGGRMGTTEITTGLKNNIFPDVSQEERTAGLTQYRKIFAKVENDDDETLGSALIHFIQTCLGDDYAALFAGTQRDTQADMISTTQYGAGVLKTTVLAGDSSLIMTIENSGLTIIRNGDTIFITDGTNSEYHENVTISKAGVDIIITLDTGDVLANGYSSATPTYIASVLDAGDIACSSDNYTDTQGANTTFDFASYPLDLDNIGTIEQTWTLTVEAGGASFALSGDTLGSVATAIPVSADYAPNNSDFTKPYFTLDKDGWGAGLSGGEVITFQTHPAAYPVWIKRIVPAGSASYASDSFSLRIYGESA